MAKVCPECRGRKKFTCGRCKGTGRFHGVHLLGHPSSPCKQCGVSGNVTCRRCNGSGRI